MTLKIGMIEEFSNLLLIELMKKLGKNCVIEHIEKSLILKICIFVYIPCYMEDQSELEVYVSPL